MTNMQINSRIKRTGQRIDTNDKLCSLETTMTERKVSKKWLGMLWPDTWKYLIVPSTSLNCMEGREIPLASGPAAAALLEGTPMPPFCSNVGPTSGVCSNRTATGGGAERERLVTYWWSERSPVWLLEGKIYRGSSFLSYSCLVILS